MTSATDVRRAGRSGRPPRAVTLVAALALLGALTVWRSTSARGDRVQEIRGETMGTTYLIKLDADMTDRERVRAQEVVETRLDRVNRLMSTYDSASELSRLNRHDTSEPFPVSEELIAVLTVSADIAARSGGAFDVTVGPLVDAWGFGPGGPLAGPPDASALSALRDRVGYERVVVDAESGTVTKTHPETVVDLSAVAKGYGVEQVVAGLAELGYGRLLVEVGGEMKAVGRRRDGSSWRVGIEAPEPGRRSVYATADLVDAGIATSGDYRNFLGEDGARYAHIIDPRTGRPLPFVGASVTVVHDDAAVADAWATALSVLGPDEGYDVAVREGLGALFVVWSEGEFGSRPTPEFLERVQSFTEVERP